MHTFWHSHSRNSGEDLGLVTTYIHTYTYTDTYTIHTTHKTVKHSHIHIPGAGRRPGAFSHCGKPAHTIMGRRLPPACKHSDSVGRWQTPTWKHCLQTHSQAYVPLHVHGHVCVRSASIVVQEPPAHRLNSRMLVRAGGPMPTS